MQSAIHIRKPGRNQPLSWLGRMDGTRRPVTPRVVREYLRGLARTCRRLSGVYLSRDNTLPPCNSSRSVPHATARSTCGKWQSADNGHVGENRAENIPGDGDETKTWASFEFDNGKLLRFNGQTCQCRNGTEALRQFPCNCKVKRGARVPT